MRAILETTNATTERKVVLGLDTVEFYNHFGSMHQLYKNDVFEIAKKST